MSWLKDKWNDVTDYYGGHINTIRNAVTDISGSGATQTGWLNALGGGASDRAGAEASSVLSRDFATGERQKAEAYNTAERVASENYQTQMSNTSYQRGIADMKKAGLNPALAYGNMSSAGASTPQSSAGRSPGSYSVSGHGAKSNSLPQMIGAVGYMATSAMKQGLNWKRFIKKKNSLKPLSPLWSKYDYKTNKFKT